MTPCPHASRKACIRRETAPLPKGLKTDQMRRPREATSREASSQLPMWAVTKKAGPRDASQRRIVSSPASQKDSKRPSRENQR